MGAPRKAIYAACDGGGHVWVVAHLPMPLADVAKLMKRAACPTCALSGKHVFLATQEQVDAAEASHG